MYYWYFSSLLAAYISQGSLAILAIWLGARQTLPDGRMLDVDSCAVNRDLFELVSSRTLPTTATRGDSDFR